MDRNPVSSIVHGRTPATFVLLGILGHGVVLAPAVRVLSRSFCVTPVAADDIGLPGCKWGFAGAVGGATSCSPG